MRSSASDVAILEYRGPETGLGTGSGLGVASLVISLVTALPFSLACQAVVDSHRDPGFYLPLVVFSYAFWIVLVGAAVGLGLAIGGLRRKRRRRGFALAGLVLSTLFLIGLTVMMILTRGGTQSA